jgi:beta-glucosidase
MGPNADNKIAVLGNYNGIPSQVVSALQGIKDKAGPGTEVVYEKAINFTNDTLLTYTDMNNQFSWEGRQGFSAEYFNNKELNGKPAIVTMEKVVDNHWQEGEALTNGIKASNFSARYSTKFTASKNGDVTFEIEADDGYRFLINEKEILNAWQRNRWGARTFKLETKKDSVYKIVLEYWQGDGKANVSIRTGNFEKTDFAALSNRVKDADAIVFVGGISPQLEGEEMQVDYPGFNGGDRTSIMLPTVQTDLMKSLHLTGKPVVFVMMTGSAIATPWESENIPAIVNAWYGGQSAGTAIADVLFGNYNPAGRLPVTFYRSDNDLPSFMSYDMAGRTYRYFNGEALYPFGYGLSYTEFKYDNLVVPATVQAGKNLTVSVRVTNTGKKSGEEVVQLYIASRTTGIQSPLRSLKGFKRILLKAGESQTVRFQLTEQDLSLVDTRGESKQMTGSVIISAGGGQPGVQIKTTSNVVSKEITIR